MADESQQPIVIKRIKKGGDAAHGGAWKVAYADFVTAMMAFFLLLWLLGSTAQGDLEGIAQFFQNPLKVAREGGAGAGDAERIIPGGGEDLSRRVGQVKRGETPSEKSMATREGGEGASPTHGRSDVEIAAGGQGRVAGTPLTEAAPAPGRGGGSSPGVGGEKLRELQQLERTRAMLEAIIEADLNLRAMKDQIQMRISDDGLVIEIVDTQNRPMFALGSAQVQDYARRLLRTVGRTLNDLPNRISIAGHTDATPYAGDGRGMSNWELSAERANAARRELIAGGLDPNRIFRVVGMADTSPLIPEDPYAPQNRRISIIVLKKEVEDAWRARENAAPLLQGYGPPPTVPSLRPAGASP
ncbi:MAG: OmpA family protein [Rhodocyclales bacterium]|nr:OmpA family protein [Rhodocyclales bacterium]